MRDLAVYSDHPLKVRHELEYTCNQAAGYINMNEPGSLEFRSFDAEKGGSEGTRCMLVYR